MFAFIIFHRCADFDCCVIYCAVKHVRKHNHCGDLLQGHYTLCHLCFEGDIAYKVFSASAAFRDCVLKTYMYEHLFSIVKNVFNKTKQTVFAYLLSRPTIARIF